MGRQTPKSRWPKLPSRRQGQLPIRAQQSGKLRGRDPISSPPRLRFETARANYQSALSNLASSQAGTDIKSAEAAVETARANHQSALSNLAKSEAGTDIKSAEAAVETAKANHQSAMSNLASFEAGTDIKSSEATLASAQASYQSSLSNLATLKAGAKASEIRTAEAAIESARASYQRAVTDLADLKAGVKPADIQDALSQLANAKSVYSQKTALSAISSWNCPESRLDKPRSRSTVSKLTLSRAAVTSPFAGVVASINANVGEQVSGGSEAAVVADPKSMRIHVDVDETDVPKVAVGQNVTLSIEALPDAELTGTVSSVSPIANVNRVWRPIR